MNEAETTRESETPEEITDGVSDSQSADAGADQDSSSIGNEHQGEQASDQNESAGECEEQQEDAQERIARLEASLLRAKADYQNLQRNSTRERSEAIRYANAGLIKSLLVVVDDFERTLASADNGDDLSAVVDGVRLIHQNLQKQLTDHGMVAIDAAGEPFDPEVHEAMMQQPSEDHPAGTVLEELARGYRVHDRVIRPSKVIVTKAVED